MKINMSNVKHAEARDDIYASQLVEFPPFLKVKKDVTILV
jgi:hypothetical protein